MGLLCQASTEEHGSMWECPLLLPLPTACPPSANLTSHQEGRSLQVGPHRLPGQGQSSKFQTHGLLPALRCAGSYAVLLGRWARKLTSPVLGISVTSSAKYGQITTPCSPGSGSLDGWQ